MKSSIKFFILIAGIFFMISCGDSEKEEKENVRLGDYTEASKEDNNKQTEESSEDAGDTGDDLSNKGIGPIDNLDLDENIDEGMASTGADLFKNMCSACHKMDKKFVGPAIEGVTERRSHEWIMNMILNPEQMIKEDPIAKKLLVESNMAIMADQGLSEDEARSILEYFRQYDQEN